VRWETKESLDGQLYQKYSYQNLLKLDHFSSSYDEKNWCVFLWLTVYNRQEKSSKTTGLLRLYPAESGVEVERYKLTPLFS